MPRVKQNSGWARAKAKGHLPCMVIVPAADRSIVEKAARQAGVRVSTYIKTVVLAQAYCDCGTARPQEVEQ